MRTTNYTSTFMTVAPDSPALRGEEPPPETAAGACLAMLRARPYGLTSDDLLFALHARRHALAQGARQEAREAFLARPQACLRASPLVKRWGWGLHHDAQGRVAAYGVETAEYGALATARDVTVVAGMRSRRAC